MLGNDGWPFTVPLVKEGELWRFDVAAGTEELLNRRIGQERAADARDAARASWTPSASTARRDATATLPPTRRSSGATRGSTTGSTGRRRPGSRRAPWAISSRRRRGKATGTTTAVRDPYHGYFYRILTAQGKSAPGGEKSYLDAKGLMTAASPPSPGRPATARAGVMTFIVNQQGIVFQKDLGEETGRPRRRSPPTTPTRPGTRRGTDRRRSWRLATTGRRPGLDEKETSVKNPDDTPHGAVHRLPLLLPGLRPDRPQAALLGDRRHPHQVFGRALDRLRGADLPGLQPCPLRPACPTGAYTQRRGGGVVVRKKLCTRCGECARACPVEAVYLDPEQEPFVCIHCGRCVPFCPHDCLELKEVAAAAPAGQEAAP